MPVAEIGIYVSGSVSYPDGEKVLATMTHCCKLERGGNEKCDGRRAQSTHGRSWGRADELRTRDTGLDEDVSRLSSDQRSRLPSSGMAGAQTTHLGGCPTLSMWFVPDAVP